MLLHFHIWHNADCSSMTLVPDIAEHLIYPYRIITQCWGYKYATIGDTMLNSLCVTIVFHQSHAFSPDKK